MVLTGIGLGIAYWIIETVYDVFTVEGAGFLDSLFGGGLSGIGTRIIVICLFVVFGSHAQYSLNKLRQAETEIANLKDKVEFLESDSSNEI
jgi:hypothetical protein